MIICATKLPVKRLAAGLLVLGAVLLGASVLTPHTAQPTAGGEQGMQTKLKNNEARVALLESYGWQVSAEPPVEQQVQLPREFDQAYTDYNALQLEQGLDLTPYRGKRATLYTYSVLNHPSGEEGVSANLLVRRNKLIAADISSAQTDGFLHGLVMPQSATQTP